MIKASVCVLLYEYRDLFIDMAVRNNRSSLRSRRYSRAQGGKLEIPPAQKLSILSSPTAG